MIANELGVTKAAVYHHFRTREDLLAAVIEPVLGEMLTVVEEAEAQRSASARAEHMLTGYVGIAVRHRELISVLAADPGTIDILRSQHGVAALIDRQVKLLADVTPGPAGLVNASVALAGVAGAAGKTLVDLDDQALSEHLVQAGRRTLGLRTPRRTPTAT
jgi:AcrR family transcriptional regulator